jgi:voltage-gated potassium channel
MLKLVKYNHAMSRYKFALKLAREELIIFGCASMILLYLSAVGMYYFEHDAQPEHFASIISSLWWAVITLTTVGYGDVYPITVGGRIFTFFILMIGLGVVAVPAGLFAAALCKAREGDSSNNDVGDSSTSSE